MMINHSILSSQQKLAEKLTILNDRGIGMLTRISNIKKACTDKDPGSKPAFLLEKSLEPTFKQIIKKFPNFEKGSLSQYSGLQNWKADILKSLSLYYNTFVDLLDLRDHVNDLLTTIDACQIHFDITLNYDLTKNYLDLISTYVSLMILLSKVDDRKTVLGLYTISHEMTHGQGDASFPRLGQMIVDYEIPMKKLAEDFVPHSKLIYESLQSLSGIYKQKNSTAEELRRNLILNLSSSPNLMLQPPFTDTINCDYLSFETIERWIVLTSPLCMGYMHHQECLDMFKNVLLNSHVHTLYRDDTILTHDFLLKFLEISKNQSSTKKLIDIVRDTQIPSFQNARFAHREKRQYLRGALRELALLFTDQPGLLGPKALYLFIGLSMARDEVHWLLRHQYLHWFDTANKPVKLTKGMGKEDWKDKSLPELLFLIEELRTLAKKYSQVIQRYYIEYLNGSDASNLNQHIEQLNTLPEDEAILLNSFNSTISALSVKQIENNEPINLRALRLDWFRFQTYTSVGKLPFSLVKHTSLAKTLNTIAFHSKLVDFIDELLMETSDLSLFCFYPNLYFENFHICFECPAQLRFSIAFPLVCSHFMSCTHELCPEERQFIGRKSIDFASKVIDDMTRETKDILAQLCEKYSELNVQLDPMQSLPFLADHITKKYSKTNNKKQQQQQTTLVKPGNESLRYNREDMNFLDKLNMALAEWCYAINYCNSIPVWEYTFYPREYLYQKLENLFNKILVQKCYVEVTEKNEKLRTYLKPSEMLNTIESYMKILMSIENHVQIDITKAFNSVLTQHTQLIDSNGYPTLTRHYCDLYIEKILKNIDRTHVIYSPSQKSFHVISKEQASDPASPENYINYIELLALTEIIGVVGAKYMIEQVNTLIFENIIKIKAIVMQNKEILQSLRINFDRPDMMKDLYKRLDIAGFNKNIFKKLDDKNKKQNVFINDVDLALVSLLNIGIYLAFKNLLMEVLNETLEKRLPYLILSAEDFSKNYGDQKFELIVNEMSASCGFSTPIDSGLYQIIKAPNAKTNPDEEYTISCLMMVLLAVSISRLTRYDSSQYKPDLQAHGNNAHCIANAINTLAGCLFYDMGAEIQRNIENRLTEFLALASSALLKLTHDTNETNGNNGNQTANMSQKEQTNRDSVYIILDQIVQSSPFLTFDLLESCFPYALLRTSYRQILKRNANTSSNGFSNASHFLIND